MLAFGLLLFLGAAAAALLVFVGCEHKVWGGSDITAPESQLCGLLFELKYDPAMRVNGVQVAVERVDFVIHRESGSSMVLDNTQTLIDMRAPRLDFTGWPDSGAVFAERTVELPRWGEFTLSFGIRPQGVIPARWSVQCNAFEHAADPDPTFVPAAAGGTIEKHVVDIGRVHPFVFTLRSDGKIAEKSVDVVLSFVYDASPSDLTSVVFYIALDSGPEIALTIRPPANASPSVLFTSSPVSDVLGNPQARTGTWHATIQKVPLGSTWAVRCEGYNKNEQPPATPRFTSGARIIKQVTGDDASYLFGFEVRTGSTEPVPHP